MGVTDNEIVFRSLKNRNMLKTQPVGVLVEQRGGNVGEMGWRPLSGGIAALWAHTIGAIVSGDIENGYSLKTRLVEAVVGWEGHRELSRVMFGSRSLWVASMAEIVLVLLERSLPHSVSDILRGGGADSSERSRVASRENTFDRCPDVRSDISESYSSATTTLLHLFLTSIPHENHSLWFIRCLNYVTTFYASNGACLRSILASYHLFV